MKISHKTPSPVSLYILGKVHDEVPLLPTVRYSKVKRNRNTVKDVAITEDLEETVCLTLQTLQRIYVNYQYVIHRFLPVCITVINVILWFFGTKSVGRFIFPHLLGIRKQCENNI
uniref:Uncharacterized protein n=1 Tax=Glossina austeni TaxID=7395 RepID=A0A1A9VSL0_GLOAU